MHSKPCKEDLLRNQIQARKIETYHPRTRVQTVKPRTRQVKSNFPGHVFVRVDLDRVDWSSLHWMPGAIGLVAFGGQPAFVPDAMIQTVRHCKVGHPSRADQKSIT